MSDRVCPQTGEACPISPLCEAETERAKQQVKRSAVINLAFGNAIVKLAGDGSLTNLIRELEGGEIPSPEASENNGILRAHAAIAASLPVPALESPETPHDSYDQLSQSICLRGTYELAKELLDRPKDQAIPILSEFIVLASKARLG